jgi:hypothetical protein
MTEESVLTNDKRFCECGCKTEISLFRKDGKPRRFVAHHWGRIEPRGSANPNWKGGCIDAGYRRVYANRKRIREHRLVYQEYHNCCLLPWIDIHHINHISTDNRPENLEAMSRGNHRRVHTERHIPANRACMMCGSSKTGAKDNRPVWYKRDNGFICMKCYLREWYKRKCKLRSSPTFH